MAAAGIANLTKLERIRFVTVSTGSRFGLHRLGERAERSSDDAPTRPDQMMGRSLSRPPLGALCSLAGLQRSIGKASAALL